MYTPLPARAYGPPIDSAARQRLASYLVHAPFSLARFHYHREAGVVTYKPRSSRGSHPYFQARIQLSPLDALAALTAFIPEKNQQIVRYYAYYSNKARGQRRCRQGEVAALAGESSSPDTTDSEEFRRFCKRARARLIKKVYLIDPLTCPKCGRRLRIISFINDPAPIEKILRHLKLWDLPERSPPPRSARSSITVEPDPDYLHWVATARQFDGID